ncbi:PorP/SprF family type IX secretion system membrane protein [Muricauda sp. 2012CJ35-5]|uniref:PorP/SprF family type IX secretion system membrane protein n=1 Tax=Flagellimonas spongiicola TaxID=2942208 RepID=A0ABT0PPG1_9FLAO|nr:PorP/SprF family type IX secretion system membrane protein [Allomuricauda spongiicola]MCL6273111.1 PorP/SprF family type IX secretion system membrane protein [Allomuricauda spongiicola]
MLRNLVWLSMLLLTTVLRSQELALPADLRQHNLTQFNASLVNPTYALDWNMPNAIALWSRWQWQTVDGDPTTILLNYTQQINSDAAAGVGFLQHNTGTFLNTGLNLNYVHSFSLENNISFYVGANVYGFQQKLADDRFMPNPDIDLPELEISESFILLFSPAIRLQVNQFNLGLMVENALDVNFSDSEGGSGDSGTVVTGTISNDFPVGLFNGFIRPIVYVKSIPNADTQFGLNGLLSTSKFWVQGGYNSFYGASGGAGVTFAKQFSVGALVEFGLDDQLQDEKSTIELVMAYHIGKTDTDKSDLEQELNAAEEEALERLEKEEEQKQLEAQQKREAAKKQQEEELKLAEERERETALQKQKDSIAAAALAEEQRIAQARQRRQDSLSNAERIQQEKIEREVAKAANQRRLDSIAEVQKEQQLLEEQRIRDSIAQVQQEKVEVRPNEKYEEVATADGLEPGFYLIANVFGTKKYFDSFMQELQQKGLNPKSFFRSLNKYNYVYLARYNSMQEARQARDSKFNGKYDGKTWIFRVRAE